MPTYRNIAATETDPFAPLTSSLMKALDDNVDATAEGATDSPVLSAGWHPFNKITVGDSFTGQIYSFATDGALASVTANFEDGYDYLIRWDRISASSGSPTLQIAGLTVSAFVLSSSTISGTLEITAPRMLNYPKTGLLHHRDPTTGANALATIGGAAASPYYGVISFGNVGAALSSVAISWSTGNIDAGSIFLYRRRNYMFG